MGNSTETVSYSLQTIINIDYFFFCCWQRILLKNASSKGYFGGFWCNFFILKYVRYEKSWSSIWNERFADISFVSSLTKNKIILGNCILGTIHLLSASLKQINPCQLVMSEVNQSSLTVVLHSLQFFSAFQILCRSHFKSREQFRKPVKLYRDNKRG